MNNCGYPFLVKRKYEHYAAAAQRLLAADHAQDVRDAGSSAAAEALVALYPGAKATAHPAGPAVSQRLVVAGVHGVQFKGDATHQEACGKKQTTPSYFSKCVVASS